jgi:menaquinone-dependent protoporphyrinogen oxidase
VEVGTILASTGTREHRIFAGKLDRSRLGLGERMVVRAVHAEVGDFRELDEVAAWASTIARELTSSAEVAQ